MSDQPTATPSVFRRLRWKGILLGFIVDNFGGLAFGFVSGIVFGIKNALGSDRQTQEAILSSVAYMGPILVVGMLFVMVGGLIAGRMAPLAPLVNGAALGVLDLAVGVIFYSQAPNWYSNIALALTMPCALLGAWLSRVIFPPSEVLPPPLPPGS